MADTTPAAEVPATETVVDDAGTKRPREETTDEGGDAAPGEESDPKKVKPDDAQAEAMAKAMAAVQALNAPGGLASVAVPVGEEIITKEVECPQTLVGKVIGKGGETIKDLQARSGAKIQVDQNMPPGIPRKVIITGVAAAVAAGERMVNEVMQSVPSQSIGEPAPGEIFESIDCPKTLVGRVIGKGGETIKMLQMRSGTRIQIDQNVPQGAPCKVQVTGNKSAVAVAVGMVKDLMVEGASGNSVLGNAIDASAPGNTSTILDCEKRLVGRIIGKGGETINYLQATSGTRIQIDQNVPEGTPCKVSIAGPAAAVANAIKMVTDCMENGNGPPRDGAGGNPYARPQTGIVYGRPAVGGYGQQAYGAGAYGGYGQSPYGGYGAGYGGAAQGYGGQGYGGYTASPAAKGGAGGYGAAASGVWSEHSTDDGTKYWYNSQTGESTWTKPQGM